MTNTAGETPQSEETTTYGYLSLIRSCGGNEAWDDEVVDHYERTVVSND